MKTYLNELSDEDKVKSRDPKEAYKEGFSEEFTYAHRCSDRAIKYLEEHKIQEKQILFLHTGGTPLFFDFLEQEDK